MVLAEVVPVSEWAGPNTALLSAVSTGRKPWPWPSSRDESLAWEVAVFKAPAVSV